MAFGVLSGGRAHGFSPVWKSNVFVGKAAKVSALTDDVTSSAAAPGFHANAGDRQENAGDR
jgi:hypothetical protein